MQSNPQFLHFLRSGGNTFELRGEDKISGLSWKGELSPYLFSFFLLMGFRTFSQYVQVESLHWPVVVLPQFLIQRWCFWSLYCQHVSGS